MRLKDVSFKGCLLIVFFTLAAFLPILSPIDEKNTSLLDDRNVIKEDIPQISNLLQSDATFSEWLAYSEQAAQWLISKANTSDGGLKWDENGVAKYGLADGVAGIGKFFIELYEKTHNNTYKDWANGVGIFLNLTHPNNYQIGKWPNKQYGSGITNSSGIEDGSAGIGKFLLELYKITFNNTYLVMAEDCAQYLNSIETAGPTGLKWEEQDPSNYDDFEIHPRYNTTVTGQNTTLFSNIMDYDKAYYTINANDSVGMYESDVIYALDLSVSGLPYHTNYRSYVSDIKVSITINSEPGDLPYSNVSIYNDYNNSWEVFGSVNDAEAELNFNVAVNESHYLFLGRLIQIRVRANDSVADFTIDIDELNATVDYADQYFSSSYSTGAAGIGDFFLDLYEATANLTYLDKAQKAAAYLISNATVIYDNASWNDKGEYYTTVPQGAAGIGNFLLRLSKINASNSDYITYARRAANWLADVAKARYGNTYRWGVNNDSDSNIIITGNDGCAGIVQFLIDFAASYYDESNPDYYNDLASDATRWLITTDIMSSSGLENYWDNREVGGEEYHSLSEGSMGAMLAINKWYLKTRTASLGTYIAGGMERIKNSINATQGFWNKTIPLAVEYEVYNLKDGVAGIAYGILQLALSSYDSLQPSIKGLTFLENEGTTYSGLYEGRAGFGMANLEVYKVQDDTTYLNKSIEHARWLLDGSNWNITDTTAQNYTGLGYGVAGIGLFQLEMYLATGNTTYLNCAILAGDWLVSKAEAPSVGERRWLQYIGGVNYYTGMEYGVAGVIYFLSKLYQSTKVNTYKLLAELGFNYLDGLQDANFGWEAHDSTTQNYNGWDLGTAGIGKSIFEVYKSNRSSTVLYSLYITFDILRKRQRGVGSWYIHDETTSVEYGMEKGVSGILKFLTEYYQFNSTTLVDTVIGYGVDWLEIQIENENVAAYGLQNGLAAVIDACLSVYSLNHDDSTLLTNLYNCKNTLVDNQNPTYYFWNSGDAGIKSGAAGIISVLVRVPDIDLPSVGNPVNPSSLEYSAAHTVSFVSSDLGSGLSSVQMNYSKNDGAGNTVLCSYSAGAWYYTFSGLVYPDVIEFSLISKDKNNLFTINDNNGANFTLTIVDTTIPVVTSKVYDTTSGGDVLRGIEYSGLGRIKANITNEPDEASGINTVILNYKEDGTGGAPTSVGMTEIGGEAGIWSYTFDATGFSYGDTIVYWIVTTDVAGNTNTTSNKTFTIGDYTQPVCIIKNDFAFHSYNLIPQYTDVILKANVTDVGAGMAEINSVWVNYSTDGGYNWNILYLNYDTTDKKYVGTLPGQMMIGIQVMYCLVAKDQAGNVVAWDIEGTTYSSAADVPFAGMFRYTIEINWIVLLIIIGIIGGISVIAVFAYSRRGSYYDKMRRKTKTTATKLVIQEKLNNAYYWMIEKLEKAGEKLGNAGTSMKSGMGNVGAWTEAHFGERSQKILRGTGRFLIGIPLGIIHGIGYFFSGLGKLIVESKLYHIIVFIMCGLLMVLMTTIQFILEGDYPLRAIFFVDLGLIMFIIGFVAIIIRSIYRLVYK